MRLKSVARSYNLKEGERWVTGNDTEKYQKLVKDEFSRLSENSGNVDQVTVFLMREWAKFGRYCTFDVNRVEYYAEKEVIMGKKVFVVEGSRGEMKNSGEIRVEGVDYELLDSEYWASETDLRILWPETLKILKTQETTPIGFCQDTFGNFGRILYKEDSINFKYNLEDPESVEQVFVMKMEVKNSETTEQILPDPLESKSGDLETENFNLKTALQRIIPKKERKTNRKRPRGGVISLKRKEDNSTPMPMAAIVATDNGKRGKRVIEELTRILEKRDSVHYLELCGGTQASRDIENPVDLKSNFPKRVIHVYSHAPYVVDKTPANLDLGLAENESVDNIVKVVRNKTDKDKPEYRVDDEMKLDNLDDEERMSKQKNELEEFKKELGSLKRKCFNCGKSTHRKSDCPDRHNGGYVAECYDRLRFLQDKIDGADPRLAGETQSSPVKKKKFKEKLLDVARPLDTTFSPGGNGVSSDLKEALGLGDSDIPSWIYSFREHGYPPEWLKMVQIMQSKKINIFHTKNDEHDENDEHEEPELLHDASLSKFDSNKLITYPGFNYAVPDNKTDNDPSSFNLEHDISEMKTYLDEHNERVDKVLEKMKDNVKDDTGLMLMEKRMKKYESEEELDEDAKLEKDKKDDALDKLMNSELGEREFTRVTEDVKSDDGMEQGAEKIGKDAKVSSKGLPNLSSWAAGIAPIDRNLCTPDAAVRRGTFKKLRALFKANKK